MKINLMIGIPCWLDMIFAWPVIVYRQWKFGYTFRRIYLDEGIYTIVDPEDYYRLKKFNWYLLIWNKKFYARCNIKIGSTETKTVSMHRMILNAPKGILVDHINGDSLDNRRANLRFATHQQNACNSRKKAGCTSKYRGVSWNKHKKKWRATLQYKGKSVFHKMFDSEIEAARTYDAAAKIHHGIFARLNFPDANPLSPLEKQG
jgi:hypothetical protein